MRRAAAALAAIALAIAGPSVEASGALYLHSSGQPFLWPDGGRSIPYNPDRGGWGKLDAATAVAQTDAAFAAWTAVPSSTASYRNAGLLPVDVNATNYGPYLFADEPDGLNAIVYDQTGAIFNSLFGFLSGVLGFAGPEWINPETAEVVEAYAFLNGGPNLILGFPTSEMLTIQVHEFGHYANLAHTSVNAQIALYGDPTGPAPFDTFPPEDLRGRIETMYPFIIREGGQETPHADDGVSLSRLYPEPSFAASHGTITGRVMRVDGLTRASGVNVVARNVANPYDDAVSSIAGDMTGSTVQSDPRTGVYRLEGLTPGATYAVYIDRLLAGGFSVTPFFPYPAPEELYNGPQETGNPQSDDPAEYQGIVAVAGQTVSDVDFFLNRPAPGPFPLGDEQTAELPLGFPFRFCGREYTLAFLNSNGTLTFERPSNGAGETTAGLFSGPPRIAAMWDDLDPSAGGSVSWDTTPNEFRVRWNEVPEYQSARLSSFGLELQRSSGEIHLDYGTITAIDGLVGLSCGGLLTSRYELPSDLSELASSADQTINARNRSALFEQFEAIRPNDLTDRSLRFTAPNDLPDLSEPNDSLARARRVALPYFSGERITGLFPAGDVDYFRFQARAGDTLVAETRAGNQIDTVLGVFDMASQSLLALDDDSGVGLLSRVAYPIPADGMYAVAVSSFPDFDFNGDGPIEGRYVLDLRTLPGIPLPLTDESAVEMLFGGFAFPFAGRTWNSVFVTSNGLLTFGQPVLDFTPTRSELLNGPPSIAPLWDDLDPGAGGYVYYRRTANSLTVTFDDVFEFGRTVPTDFAVTMWNTGAIEFRYGEHGGNDGIVGVSPGGGVEDPGEIDLSAATAEFPLEVPIYEDFGFGQFDLDGRALMFGLPPAPLADADGVLRLRRP